MTWRQGATEGWRLARPTFAAVFTRARRRTFTWVLSATGLVVSALVHLVTASRETEPRASLLALAAGIVAASLLSSLMAQKWLPPKIETPPRPARGAVVPSDGVQKRIADAWRSGVEPDAPIGERLAAATRARDTLATFPRYMALEVSWTGFVLALVVSAVTFVLVYPSPTSFVMVIVLFNVANSVARVAQNFAVLGRTTAAIETAPDVPDHLEADGRAKRRPTKLLGTDHPDDYT